MRASELIESTREAIAKLEEYGAAARDLREKMSRVPPDQLSLTDLLAMRAGTLRNLETYEAVIAGHVTLLKTIVGLWNAGPRSGITSEFTAHSDSRTK
jgi:hypothetical protein